MKTFLIILILLVFVKTNAQTDSTQLFLGYFEKIQVPFNTSSYNKYYEKELPEDLALMFIFKNNESSSKYYFELYSNEDNSITKSGEKLFRIFPINYAKLDSISLITYYKSSIINDRGYYLSIIDHDGFPLDSLIIYDIENEYEFWKWLRAIIMEDRVVVIQYLLIPKNKSENQEKTKIQISEYSFDSNTKKFHLLNQEIIFSRYFVHDFFKASNEEVISEDPYYKY